MLRNTSMPSMSCMWRSSNTTSKTPSCRISSASVPEAAVRVLEDLPQFNAGHGSVLTERGTVEMDALIMDGRTLAAGAVTVCDAVVNPITLARAVAERSPHVLLAGGAARELAARVGRAFLPSIGSVRLQGQGFWAQGAALECRSL